MMNKIKIIIADDHSLFITGLQLLLKEESWIEITDIANNGIELLDILHINQPDLILLDLNMPHLNGLEAGRHIKQNSPLRVTVSAVRQGSWRARRAQG